MRDLRLLTLNLQVMKPSPLMINMVVSDIRCLIKKDQIHFFNTSGQFLSEFLNVYSISDQFPQFELRCIDAILSFVSADLGSSITATQTFVKSITAKTKMSLINQERQKLETYAKETTQAIELLDDILDNEEDMAGLCFSVQRHFDRFHIAKQPQVSCSFTKKKQLPQTVKIQISNIQNGLNTHYYGFKLLLQRIQALQNQIDSAMTVIRLRLQEFEVKTGNVEVFYEIYSTAIAVLNIFPTIWGSNMKTYTHHKWGRGYDFYLLCCLSGLLFVMYLIFYWKNFKYNMKRYEECSQLD